MISRSQTPGTRQLEAVALMPARGGKARLALRLTADREDVDGVWWPRSRMLRVELPDLFTTWPAEAGHITHVLYSRPDWDDRPRAVEVPGRRGPLRTWTTPGDLAPQVVLTMLDGQRRLLGLVAPGADDAAAARQLAEFNPPGRRLLGWQR